MTGRGSRRLVELAHDATPMGDVTLRRRQDPVLGEVHEVLLDDEYLMSSAFTAAERLLADYGLAEHGSGPGPRERLDVVVGGLGLGCTAARALSQDRVGTLVVVDALAEVVRWHERRLLPESSQLVDDPRCSFRVADVFTLFAQPEGLGPDGVDVVLLDVDHSPTHLLHPSHAAFYEVDGLRRLAAQLRPGGVFALWADQRPDPDFLERLGEVFEVASSERVWFPNPLTGGNSSSTLYTARVSGPTT